MAKIPYLFRRKNVFYFRLIIPTEQHSALDFKQIALSLRTQDKEKAIPRALKPASHFKAFLQDLKTGKAAKLSRSELKSQASAIPDPGKSAFHASTDFNSSPRNQSKTSAPFCLPLSMTS